MDWAGRRRRRVCRRNVERRRQIHLTDIVAFLEQLPPGPLYVGIALLAAIENFFPPVPADMAIALGAFLAGRGVMNPWLVFVFTWVANVTSAAAVYALARRHGEVVTRGFLGRHIFTPNTVAQIARQYKKHGTYGIFLSRLLPIWRGVVMPFAGIARLPPARALIPMALASAVYYGALTWVVTRLGTDFETVVQHVMHANKVLTIVAGAIVLIIVVWIVRRRLQRPPPPPPS